MARERKHPRRTKRRGRFRFLYKLISLVVVAAAMVTACVIFFRVNEVRVEGNSHYTPQEIIEASEIEMGDNLVTLWTWQINQLVGSKLPYVQRVVVGHTFPDKVTLQVVERTVERQVAIRFEYPLMNEVMRVVKETGAQVLAQSYDQDCRMTLSIRLQDAPALVAKLDKLHATVE